MTGNLKVLYLTYDGLTDPLGQSQILPYLFGLAVRGYRFTIISFEKEERFQKQGRSMKEELEQYNIIWYPLPYTKKPPVLSTLKDVYKLRKLAFRLHRQEPFQIVHCRSYITSLVGLALKRSNIQHPTSNIQFIFDMRGFWADERVEGGIWNLKNPLYRLIYNFFKKKEKAFLEEADHIISLTETGKEEIGKWNLKGQPLPITVIPCCVDMDLFDPAKVEEKKVKEYRQLLGLEGAFVVLYIGSIGTWYLPEEMMDFFRILKEKKPEAKFLFVTREDPEFILNAAKKRGVREEDIVITSGERSEMPVYIALADLPLFFITPCFSKKASSPVKQGEIMSMGKPFVCNDIGDTGKIVRESGCGVLVDDFSEKGLRAAVDKVDEVVQQTRPENIRAAGEKYFSLAGGVQLYQQVYEMVQS